MKYLFLGLFSLLTVLLVGAFSLVAALPLGSPNSIAQAPFSSLNRVWVFTNADWQVVPGADVGRHPAETLMNMNSILREGDAVTFDVTGHRGVYYRMTGNCLTNQVARTRQGISQGNDQFSYQEITPITISTLAWDSQLLSFACQNSDDCQETIAEYNRLNETLETLDKVKESYADLAAKLAIANYDLARIIGSLEDTSTQLANAETQLMQLHADFPSRTYQDYLQEHQRTENVSPELSFDYARALTSRACDNIPDWQSIIPAFEYIGNIVPGYTDNPLLAFGVEQAVDSLSQVLQAHPYVRIAMQLSNVVSLVCLADDLDRNSFTSPARLREYQARLNSLRGQILEHRENLIFADSSISAIQKERQAASDEIYRIVNRDLYNNTDEYIDSVIENHQTPSPEAMLAMLRELDDWQQELKNRLDEMSSSPCLA